MQSGRLLPPCPLSHSGRLTILLVTSYYRNWDKHWLGEALGWGTDYLYCSVLCFVLHDVSTVRNFLLLNHVVNPLLRNSKITNYEYCIVLNKRQLNLRIESSHWIPEYFIITIFTRMILPGNSIIFNNSYLTFFFVLWKRWSQHIEVESVIRWNYTGIWY